VTLNNTDWIQLLGHPLHGFGLLRPAVARFLLEQRHVIDENHLSSPEAYTEIRQHIANMLGIPENEIPKVSPLDASQI
jgi:hypothetical protein